MPNGKIIVFSGLLPVAKDEAGLAAILGHEVAHVVAQHLAERVSQQIAARLALQAMDIGLALARVRFRGLVAAATGVGLQYGLLLPFSRAHESEADRLGQIFMARAGYDPSEAIGTWERMEQQEGSGPWEFLSTHPSPASRQAKLREWLPEARRYYAERNRTLVVAATTAQDSGAERSTVSPPEAPRPSFLPGYTCRVQVSNRQKPLTLRFARIDSCSTGTCFVQESDLGVSTFLTPDYAVIETKRSDGASITFSPPLSFMDWPLRVGATKSSKVRIKDFNGQERERAFTSEVVAYESVTTRADTFMGFHIKVSADGLPFRDSWYVPEIRNEVKVISRSGFFQSVTFELLDYQETSAPVIEPNRAEPGATM